jgi:hypothetical protein
MSFCPDTFHYLFFLPRISCDINIVFLPESPSRSLQLVSVHVPQSEERQETKERTRELDLASIFYQGIHVERRKEENGGGLSSGNTRTGSRVSVWMQRVQRFLKSLLSRTRSTGDTRSNESNICTTKNDQSSTNPKQVSAPAEKLTATNPHLADGDMKDMEGNNTMRPHQQEEFLATDGEDDEEKDEVQ